MSEIQRNDRVINLGGGHQPGGGGHQPGGGVSPRRSPRHTWDGSEGDRDFNRKERPCVQRLVPEAHPRKEVPGSFLKAEGPMTKLWRRIRFSPQENRPRTEKKLSLQTDGGSAAGITQDLAASGTAA